MQSKNEFISDLSVVAFTVPSPQECVAAIRIKDPAVVGFSLRLPQWCSSDASSLTHMQPIPSNWTF
jgi:hypothetical protein